MSTKNIQFIFVSVLLFGLAFMAGCSSVVYSPQEEARFVKPTIAVISFENRAQPTMRDQIGDGMSDQLTARLIATKRYVVLERQHFSEILRELSNSQNSMFREQGRLKSGDLKLVNYLIRGVITDYGHVETNQGLGRLLDLGLFGPSSYVVVAATLTVVDVQTGQTVASVSVEGRAKTTSQKADMRDDSIAFGGHAFYKSSLGKATNEMLDKAVEAITQMIAEEQFRPRIASIDGSTVYITGGKDRMITEGKEYFVRGIPKIITDPATGDSLGSIPGYYIGKVKIVNVMEKYSIARILSGNNYEPGQELFDPEEDATFNRTSATEPVTPFLTREPQ